MNKEIKPAYVTFEQAEWLKEKGFDEYCYLAYNSKGKLLDESPTYDEEYYMTLKDFIYIPEQHQVVEWLRVTYGIWVLIDIDDVKHSLCNYVVKWHNEICLNENRGKGYKTPQEAYSAAFDYIKNNNLI